MCKRLFADSLLLGFLLGWFPILLSYYSWIYYEVLMQYLGILKFRLYPPRLQLIFLAISLIIFRFMMVKWTLIKTGKGFFITLFTVTLIYFFNNRYKLF